MSCLRRCELRTDRANMSQKRNYRFGEPADKPSRKERGFRIIDAASVGGLYYSIGSDRVRSRSVDQRDYNFIRSGRPLGERHPSLAAAFAGPSATLVSGYRLPISRSFGSASTHWKDINIYL
jgi:hypothetical protein